MRAVGLPPAFRSADVSRSLARARRSERTGAVEESRQDAFTHLEGILAGLWYPISNGPAEGFNSAIPALKNVARGYRNFADFRIAILFHHGKLDLVTR